ncbi:hypothetical protein RSAG8_04185, partial [Rhizoctonia solani AG-8 WAC10335]
MGVGAPPASERAKEVLKTEGEVKRRMFCTRGAIYATEFTTEPRDSALLSLHHSERTGKD